MKEETFIQIAGICGVLFPILLFTTIGISLLQSPWFNWTEYAISDLYVTGIFNYGMIISGILAFAFTVGLHKVSGEKIGAFFLIISTIGLIGLGIFPVPYPLHFPFSAILFLFIGIAFGFIGFVEKPIPFFEHKMHLFARIVFVIIAFSFIPFIIFKGVAIAEVTVLIPASIWCMVYGMKMMTAE